MKKQKTIEKTEVTQEEVEVVRKKQKCGVCDDELDSDAEEEREKNVGCDTCPRWVRLNCMKLLGQSYNDVRNQYFYWDFCSDE
ncbi:hypothetical protein JTB14_037293 [Gonioctena quinquepunctata]|nr:hypothetical protein JTB14_037293 [Gonioctena quinquepunctata]